MCWIQRLGFQYTRPTGGPHLQSQVGDSKMLVTMTPEGKGIWETKRKWTSWKNGDKLGLLKERCRRGAHIRLCTCKILRDLATVCLTVCVEVRRKECNDDGCADK